MELQLSSDQVTELRVIQKRERFHRRRFVKATVLLMLHRGLSLEDIAVSLSLDECTIRRYQLGFINKGMKDYLSDNYVPYSGRLFKVQVKELSDHLDEHLYLDVKPIIAWVTDQFNMVYSISSMRDLLHRIGFVYKQTKAVASRADDDEQHDFLENQSPKLLDEVAAGSAEVYYANGCHPTHNTKTDRG